MGKHLGLVLAAGLVCAAGGSAAADCEMKHSPDSAAHFSAPAVMVRMDEGACCVHPGALESGRPDMAVADLTALHNLYAREMLASAILDAHMTEALKKQDPAMTALFGRMLVDHLQTASRARQVYLASDAALPVVTTDVALLAAPAAHTQTGTMPNAVNWHAGMEATYAQAKAPAVRALIAQAQATAASDARYIADARNVYREQVAGVRQELGDTEILARFHAKQSLEAHNLRAAAEKARTSGRAELAATFEKMAADHENLARRSAELLKARGVDAVTASVTSSAVSEAPANHSWEHHQVVLDELGNMYLQADDPAVRDLLNTAIRGTTEHLRLLMPHVPGTDAHEH